jgi:hypothetical protein
VSLAGADPGHGGVPTEVSTGTTAVLGERTFVAFPAPCGHEDVAFSGKDADALEELTRVPPPTTASMFRQSFYMRNTIKSALLALTTPRRENRAKGYRNNSPAGARSRAQVAVSK